AAADARGGTPRPAGPIARRDDLLAADDRVGAAARRLQQLTLAAAPQGAGGDRALDRAAHAPPVVAPLVARAAVEVAARARRLHHRPDGVDVAAVLVGAAALEAEVARARIEKVTVLVDAVVGKLAGTGVADGVAVVAVVGE